MIRSHRLAVLVALALLAGFGGREAAAGPVYGTPVAPAYFLSGNTRSSNDPNQLITFGDYTGGAVETLTWEIADLGNDTWSYRYIFTGFTPAVSHLILELSYDAVYDEAGDLSPDPLAVDDPEENGVDFPSGDVIFGTYGPASGNPGFPAGTSIVGVKFDNLGSSPLTIEFLSNRAPVWGNVYAKGGKSSLWNTGLQNLSSSDIQNFIARPNGGSVTSVPEPATLASTALGLVFAAIVRFRRRTASV
ncbi:MAG: PEP-CTERM sorting domain-containing protein [Isosphaeraceae bacterium]|nr:PEP-CTERM sorting domain-containing protein [Isosphaeraceae bacterium]